MDKSQLTQHQILSFFPPGFIFIACYLFIYFYPANNIDFLSHFFEEIKIIGPLGGIGIIVFSFIIGLIFDAIRNGILENALPSKINWEYFHHDTTTKKLDGFYRRYYSYYVFDLNVSISLFICTIMLFLSASCNKTFNYLIAINLIAIVFLAIDAFDLRKEMSTITNKPIIP